MGSGLSTYLTLQDRDRVPYTPGEQSINHVRVIITEAGAADPSPFQINGAYITLGARDGLTVGDVAEQVLRDAGVQTSLF